LHEELLDLPTACMLDCMSGHQTRSVLYNTTVIQVITSKNCTILPYFIGK